MQTLLCQANSKAIRPNPIHRTQLPDHTLEVCFRAGLTITYFFFEVSVSYVVVLRGLCLYCIFVLCSCILVFL